MVRSVGRVALAAVALWLTIGIAGIAAAQDRRQNEPGQFDFYLLTLSWSPSFCEASAERSSRTNRDEQNGDQQATAQTRGGDAQAQTDSTGDQARRSRNEQCGDRPYSFVVHGL